MRFANQEIGCHEDVVGDYAHPGAVSLFFTSVSNAEPHDPRYKRGPVGEYAHLGKMRRGVYLYYIRYHMKRLSKLPKIYSNLYVLYSAGFD